MSSRAWSAAGLTPVDRRPTSRTPRPAAPSDAALAAGRGVQPGTARLPILPCPVAPKPSPDFQLWRCRKRARACNFVGCKHATADAEVLVNADVSGGLED